MRHWHSNIDLWYGTTDAPAALSRVPALVPIPITVGVRPIHSANVVTIRYTVDGGATTTAPARLVDTDHALNAQYFEVMLPRFNASSVVRYVAICDCDGRRAPDRATIASLPASFTVTTTTTTTPLPTRVPWRPTPLARPVDLATARAQRKTLAAALRDLRVQYAQTARQVADLRTRVPATDPQATTLSDTLRRLGNEIAQNVSNLRSLAGFIPRLKPALPPVLSTPLEGMSDRYPILLFPVRIETRFDRARPRLCVRIYPDQLAVDRHIDGLTTQEELDGGDWLAETTVAGVTDEAKREAWRKLADRHGSTRAAWIANRMTSPEPRISLGDDPAMPPPKAFVLPDYFIVTLYRGNTIAYQRTTLPIDDELAMLWDPQDPGVANGQLFDAGSRWMSDFDVAVKAGMALAIDLVAGDLLKPFTRLTVVGARVSDTPENSQSLIEQFIDHHHYTDGLAFLAPGTATNNTGEQPSGYSQTTDDADLSFAIERQRSTETTKSEEQGERLAWALGISRSKLEYVEGERSNEWRHAREMQLALWPATGGYVFQHLLPISDTTNAYLQTHFHDLVRARGPVPVLRIGKQPYGVLPVTKVRGWQPSVMDSMIRGTTNLAMVEFHKDLHAVMLDFFNTWMTFSDRPDLVPRVGGTQDLDKELLEILGMRAGSTEVRTRAFIDERLVSFQFPTLLRDAVWGRAATLGLTAAKEASHRWQEAWDRLKASTMARIARLLLATGNASAGSPPLLQLFGWRDSFPVSMPLLTNTGWSNGPGGYLQPLSTGIIPTRTTSTDTLLLELLVNSLKRTTNATTLQSAIGALQAVSSPVLEGLLRDALDLCSYRLDAWLTSLATLRLRAMRRTKPKGLYIGAYGWVDSVQLQSDPLDGAGYIHAPSVAHAAAGAVLRNAFLSHNAALENPFAVNLTSGRVSRALELIEGVRLGQPLSVLLGYQFERGLHDRARDSHIETFRTAYPLVANKEVAPVTGDAVEAVAARNVVDGMLLAIAWRNARGPDALPKAPPIAMSATLSVSDPAVIEELECAVDSLDSVGDVLLTEGVFQSVQGNFDRAGAALDALAGVAPPPEPEVTMTPLPGTSLENRLCVLLDGSASAPAGSGPRALAEPRLAAWFADIFGFPSIYFSVTYKVGLTGAVSTVRLPLSQLGLDTTDLVYLSAFPAAGELTEIERRIAYHARKLPAADPDGEVTIAFDRGTNRSLGEAMELGQRVLDLIGSARPLQPESLGLPETAHQGPALDGGSYTDLRTRVLSAQVRMDRAATEIITRLAEIADGARIDLRVSIPDELNLSLSDALLTLSRFGIDTAIPSGPIMTDARRKLFEGAVETARARSAECTKVLAQAAVYYAGWAPENDLEYGSNGANGTAPPPPPHYEKACEELQIAMKALFGDRFVALARFVLSTTASAELGQALSHTHVAGGDQPERVMLWMEQAALTHDSAERLDDLLLTADAWRSTPATSAGGGFYSFGPMVPRSLRVAQLPHDPAVPWLALSDDERQTSIRPRGRVNIVALAPNAFNASGLIAGLMLEQWNETIPSEDVRTGLSFYFDRPNSQAPQSLLVAVPHTLGALEGWWALSDLVDIVRDTADLTRVRAVDPEALESLAPLLPGTFLPADIDRPTYLREVTLPTVTQVVHAIVSS